MIGSSERLASAYGIAVTGTLAIDTLLFFFVVRALWGRSLGLVIPGGGQFYTGRTLRGALTLAGAGVALACGLRQSVSTESVQRTAIDPFGNPYTYTTTQRVADHPCRTPGFTAAGVIAIVSAIDAFRFAQR